MPEYTDVVCSTLRGVAKHADYGRYAVTVAAHQVANKLPNCDTIDLDIIVCNQRKCCVDQQVLRVEQMDDAYVRSAFRGEGPHRAEGLVDI